MKRLSVVVPYRDREDHLKTFLPELEKYLCNDGIQYHVFIIGQNDKKPFNRAKLLNVGFKESEEYDYFAFHDVDMIPLDSDYGFPDGPTHLASSVEQFNWELPYEGYFGGVTLFDKDSFIKINGYSNEYWGWGAEDDDILHRCITKDIETYRKDCKYRSLNHDRKIEIPLYHKNLDRLKKFQLQSDPLKIMEGDGISNLKYEMIGKARMTENSTFIKVNL